MRLDPLVTAGRDAIGADLVARCRVGAIRSARTITQRTRPGATGERGGIGEQGYRNLSCTSSQAVSRAPCSQAWFLGIHFVTSPSP